MADRAVVSMHRARRDFRIVVHLRSGALLTSAVALLFLAGLISAAAGLWFVLGDHPFQHAGGHSTDVGMSRAQIEAFNARVAEWMHSFPEGGDRR